MEHSTYFLYFAILVSVVALIVVIKEIYKMIQRKRRESFNYYNVKFFVTPTYYDQVIQARSEDEAKQYVYDTYGNDGSSIWIITVNKIPDKVTGDKR